jgi:hypothetical protein
MAYVETQKYYQVVDSVIGDRSTTQYAPNDTDAFKAAHGDYRVWEDKDAVNPYGSFAYSQPDPMVIDEPNTRITQLYVWHDLSAADKRQRITDNIGAQVSAPSAKDLIDDPDIEKDVIREESAAEDKRIELQNTQDAALDDFDPTIAVAPKQNGVEYSRLIADLLMQEPWVGTPDNVYGPVVSLTVQSGYEDQGSEARMNVVAPGAVNIPSLTFVQRAAPDDNVWDLVYPSDRLWASPDDSCTVELLWGVGSVPVSRRIQLNGYGHRVGQPVRYGVAGGQGTRRR